MTTPIGKLLDGTVNPILLKEIRQGFRGRGLLMGAGGALLFSLLAFAVTVAQRTPRGNELFLPLAACMCAVSLVVVPLGLGWQLRKEIGDRTFELIAITNLGPWQNVYGRFLAGAVKLVLIVALLAPFLMSAVILGGVGFGDVLLAIGLCLASGIVFCSFSLTMAALATLRSGLVTVFANACFLVVPFAAIGPIIFTEGFRSSSGSAGGELVFWTCWVALLAGLLSLLFVSAAADLLTPPWVRRYRRSKGLLALVVLALCGAGPALDALSLHHDSDLPSICLFLSLLLLFAFSTFWAGSTLPERPAAGRLPELRDRFFSTVLYVLVASGVAAALALSALHEERFVASFTSVGCVYFVLACGIARALRRVLRSRHPALFPGVVAGFAALVLFMAIVVQANGGTPHGLVLLLDPLRYVDRPVFWEEGGLLVVPLALGVGLGLLGRPRAAAPDVAEAPAGHG